MKITAALTALIMIGLVSGTRAEGVHAVHGLYCKTEAQVDAAIGLIERDVPPPVAAEMINGEGVVCVFADKIWYLFVRPVIIGQREHRGVSLIKYEGTLVGVLVGRNPRSVEPPMRIFFVLPERLKGATASGGA